MKKISNKLSICISLMLCVAMLFSIGSVFADEGTVEEYSIKDEATQYIQTMVSYIRENVSEQCTWDDNTTVSNEFPLYDLEGNINGYVFEFMNGAIEAGFMQINMSSETYKIDSYSFGDVHCSTTLLKSPDNSSKLLEQNPKIIYLGGYTYFVEIQSNTRSNITYLDLLSSTEISLDTTAINILIENSSLNAEQSPANLSGQTITAFVKGYTGLTWATYGSFFNSDYACSAIAGTNICKYWSYDRGKTNLYPSMVDVYNSLYTKMKVDPSQGGAFGKNAYNGLYQHMVSQGSTPSYRGNPSTISWSTAMSLVDKGVPFIFGCLYPQYAPDQDDLVSTHHAMACIGYQYIGIPNMLILADGISSSSVYKEFSSLDQKFANDSSYNGWL